MKSYIPLWMIVQLVFALTWYTEQVSGEQSDEENYRTIKLTLHPVTEPVPALRYEFLPKIIDQIPGNAALIYSQATDFLLTKEEHKETFDKLNDLVNNNPSEISADQLRQGQALIPPALWHQLELATRREVCDWELPILSEGYDLLLPHLSDIRRMAKYLSLKIRLDIMDNQLPQALEHLTQGFTIAQHATDGTVLIQDLVSISIASLMLKDIEYLIEQPDAPNLYWALSTLPAPFIDIRHSMRYESEVMLIEFPQLRDIESKILTLQEASELGYSFFRRLLEFGNDSDFFNGALPFAGWVTLHYSDAKQYLANHGKSASEIESMPAAQAVILYQWLQFQIARDHLFKWFNFPYTQAAPHLKKTEDHLDKLLQNKVKNNLFLNFLPALSRAYYMHARLDRRIAALRCVEAIRLYAAKHNQLPDSLDDITDVVIPLNPVDGQPFEYQRNGQQATLATAIPKEVHKGKGLRYEITLKPNMEN